MSEENEILNNIELENTWEPRKFLANAWHLPREKLVFGRESEMS